MYTAASARNAEAIGRLRRNAVAQNAEAHIRRLRRNAESQETKPLKTPKHLRVWDKPLKRQFRREIHRSRFLQYAFFRQWEELKAYAHQKGIRIMGDLPIYVTYESADVWLDPDLFQLDGSRRPTHVAGVPPDYFSRTGQLWGNPLYRWEVLQRRGYDWWLGRLQHSLR